MEWLVLGALGIMWAVALLPGRRRRVRRSSGSVEDFGRRMDLLANVEGSAQGRWIVTPRKGVAFLGSHDRAEARARERRRRVFTFLLEVIGLSFLIGVVPPLRVMWMGTAVFTGLLVAYVWLLLTIKARERGTPRPQETVRKVHEQALRAPAAAARYVAEGVSRTARPAYRGLGAVTSEDDVHVVVLPPSAELRTARA
jgi:hypothetical protein